MGRPIRLATAMVDRGTETGPDQIDGTASWAATFRMRKMPTPTPHRARQQPGRTDRVMRRRDRGHRDKEHRREVHDLSSEGDAGVVTARAITAPTTNQASSTKSRGHQPSCQRGRGPQPTRLAPPQMRPCAPTASTACAWRDVRTPTRDRAQDALGGTNAGPRFPPPSLRQISHRETTPH